MSDDWDPFGDPADEVPISHAPVSSTVKMDSPRHDGRENWAADRCVCDYAGELPSIPRMTASSSSPWSPQEFAAELKSICDAWDMTAPAKKTLRTFPENEDGERMMALREQVGGAGVEMTFRYMSVLSRRAASELDRFREKKPASTAMFFALMALATELGASLSDDCVADEPLAAFSGTVVFVFGYGGSTMPDLSDCPVAYHDIDPGCLVVTLIFRAGTLAGAGQLAFALEHAVNAWADAAISNPKLFIHLHSNLGVMAWKQFLHLWECQVKTPDTNRLRGPVPSMSDALAGIVYDSSPAPMISRENSINSLIQSYAAQLSIVNGTKENGDPMDQKEMAKEAFRAKMSVMGGEGMLQKYFAAWSDQEIRNVTAINVDEVHEKEPPAPLLFIFSEADNVIVASAVEQYIGDVRRRPNPPVSVQQLKLKSSAHCQHRRTPSDKDAYWKAVFSCWRAAIGVDNE